MIIVNYLIDYETKCAIFSSRSIILSKPYIIEGYILPKIDIIEACYYNFY